MDLYILVSVSVLLLIYSIIITVKIFKGLVLIRQMKLNYQKYLDLCKITKLYFEKAKTDTNFMFKYSTRANSIVSRALNIPENDGYMYDVLREELIENEIPEIKKQERSKTLNEIIK